MPLKLNVNICRKIGQPAYGSLGASCGVELELPASLVSDDIEAFHRQVQDAYSACRQAVNDELARSQQAAGSGGSDPQPIQRTSCNDTRQPSVGTTNGNGARPATEKQLGYIQQLASQIKGLGARRLDTLADSMFGKPVAELTSLDASGVIDCLKGIKAGEIDLQAALNGAVT